MIRRRSAPYAGTEVPPERSKVEIEQLLRKYGADGVQWSESWKDNRAQLRFVIQQEGHQPIVIKIEPPPFAAPRKTYDSASGRYVTASAPNWAQSYRLLKAYLKAKLEAIAFGLRDVEEEFLSDMVVRDKTGRESTVGEFAASMISSGELLPALPEPPRPDAEGRSRPIDAESRVVL